MKNNNFDWKKQMIECLESTTFLALSTISSDKNSWTCPVYFSYDKDFNLYFMSQPKSKHMQNIIKNKNISAAIYSTKYTPEDDVIGMQLTGKAIILSDKEIETAYNYHYTRRFSNQKAHPDKKPDYFKGSEAEWKFVKIIPEEMYYFDTHFFGEERQTVPKAI